MHCAWVVVEAGSIVVFRKELERYLKGFGQTNETGLILHGIV